MLIDSCVLFTVQYLLQQKVSSACRTIFKGFSKSFGYNVYSCFQLLVDPDLGGALSDDLHCFGMLTCSSTTSGSISIQTLWHNIRRRALENTRPVKVASPALASIMKLSVTPQKS